MDRNYLETLIAYLRLVAMYFRNVMQFTINIIVNKNNN